MAKPTTQAKETEVKKPEPRRRPQARPLPPPPKPTAVEEYDHGDTQFDPDLDLAPEREDKPRDDTGKFVKQQDTPAAPTHPKGLVRLATRFGLTEDEIKSTSTEELSNIVSHVVNERERERESATFERDVRRSGPSAEPAPVASTPDPDDFGLNFEDEDQYDPILVRENKKMAAELAATRKRLKALEESVGALAGLENRRQAETQNQRIDRFFNSLSEPLKDIIGRGTREEIAKASPIKFAIRKELLKEAAKIDKSVSEEALHQAVQKAFPTVAASTPAPGSTPAPAAAPPAANGSRISEEEWNAAALNRPTQRDTEEPRGVNRAAKAVGRKMREMDMTEEDMAGIEEAGMPD